MTRERVVIAGVLALGVGCLLAACSGRSQAPASSGAGNVSDQGDGGTDGGLPQADGGNPDAGPADGGPTDGGPSDGGPHFGGPGPWPVKNVTYGHDDGIAETPVVGTSTDETQNLWVATHDALYLLQPGQQTFKRYDAKDGLHLQSNPVMYVEHFCTLAGSGPGYPPPIAGAAVDPGISEIVGGGPDEVFVGYYGDTSGDGTCYDPGRHTGKLDRVRLRPDGTLDVARFDLHSVDHGWVYWHNRTVWRMVYDHFFHPHTLYVGTNHGVDMILPDAYQPPGPIESNDDLFATWMGDHLHAVVCFHAPCDPNSEANQRMGDWRGLAISKDGDLWHAGRWTAGKIKWDPNALDWFSRGGNAFSMAFGDPYPPSPPVFAPPQEGDAVNMSAVTETPDGKAWFSSFSPFSGTDLQNASYGIASMKAGVGFTYYNPLDLGLGEYQVQDMVALPDGRLVIAGAHTGLVLWNPTTGDHTAIHAGQGIPDDNVLRLELDTMVDPPALHVSTASGAAVLRQLP